MTQAREESASAREEWFVAILEYLSSRSADSMARSTHRPWPTAGIQLLKADVPNYCDCRLCLEAVETEQALHHLDRPLQSGNADDTAAEAQIKSFVLLTVQ